MPQKIFFKDLQFMFLINFFTNEQLVLINRLSMGCYQRTDCLQDYWKDLKGKDYLHIITGKDCFVLVVWNLTVQVSYSYTKYSDLGLIEFLLHNLDQQNFLVMQRANDHPGTLSLNLFVIVSPMDVIIVKIFSCCQCYCLVAVNVLERFI